MCIKTGGGPSSRVGPAVNIWVDLAVYSSNDAGQELMDFLKTPFTANAGGVALTGQVSGTITGATKVECSTAEESYDQISSVLNTLAAQNPDAADLAVRVNGPSGSWTIAVAAGPEGTNPVVTC